MYEIVYNFIVIILQWLVKNLLIYRKYIKTKLINIIFDKNREISVLAINHLHKKIGLLVIFLPSLALETFNFWKNYFLVQVLGIPWWEIPPSHREFIVNPEQIVPFDEPISIYFGILPFHSRTGLDKVGFATIRIWQLNTCYYW